MATRRPLVAGNWKLNGTRASVVDLAGSVADGLSKASDGAAPDVVLCPSTVHMADVVDVIAFSSVHLGAQNCSQESTGAFTGEVSAQMLTEYGCEYVIVGHSERRALYGETSDVVALKCLAVQKAGMTPILCIGETLQEREAGRVDQIIDEQLDAVLSAGTVNAFASMVVAYEPVWAIGTGKTATPDQAQEVHAMIRQKLAHLDAAIADDLRVLYGGSVKADNAATLFDQQDIDGGLIGGASLDADSFLAICKAAA